MKVLSRLALDLYRSGRETPVDRFQQWAMDRLKSDLPFDAGKWVSGHMEGDVPVVHSVKLINRPASMHADYEHIRQHDFLAREVVANVNTAMIFNRVGDRPGLAAEFMTYLDKWRTAHSMVCARVDPFTDLATGLALWRESRDAPFTEAERRLFEAAVPHLIETFAINRILHVVRATQPLNAAAYASAIGDAQARLQVVPLEFQKMLLREWPDWRGNRLPVDLASLAGDDPGARYVGRKVYFRSARIQDLYLLQARAKRAADDLTPRELQIARLASSGLTYKQVAARLAISAATVRTHLSAIYDKLAVRKQAEMVSLLDEVQ
jgi:DNA-binding CsgD family transcriptional regulator